MLGRGERGTRIRAICTKQWGGRRRRRKVVVQAGGVHVSLQASRFVCLKVGVGSWG